jgi:hypothetical protein
VAESLQRAAEEARELAGQPGLKAGQAAEGMKKLGERLAQDRKQFQEQATEPLEHLAAAYPLMEDEARFVELYQRQRDLAERLQSLEGQDAADDPKLKARMRDLEAEQRQLRGDLSGLLADIAEHVARLPDDATFDKLRSTAEDFARAVRTSGATEAMANAESGLAEFSGTQGHASAKEAADILEQFLSKCSGMGKDGEAGQCLAFNPSLGECLGNTIEQLLADAGLKPGGKSGSGMGEGTGGGYSSRRSTLQNVGLYGKMPALGPSARSGFGQNRVGVPGRGDPAENPAGRDPSLVGAAGELRATGAGATAVPLKYRRSVSQYFERIADETGGR